jgi:hypothetical protein
MSDLTPPTNLHIAPPAAPVRVKTRLGSAIDRGLGHWSDLVDGGFRFVGVPVDRSVKTVVAATEKSKSFFSRILDAFSWVGEKFKQIDDKIGLSVYGENGKTRRVSMDLAVFYLLLSFSLSFELFAWTNMWGESGMTGFWSVVLPLIFAGMVLFVERGLLTMDDPGGNKRLLAILGRVSMLLVLSLITAVPVEMKVFAPEIDRVIESREKVKTDEIRKKAMAFEMDRGNTEQTMTSTALAGQPADVVTRRSSEREALLKQMAADRASISGRLDKKSEDLANEVSHGSRTGRTGNGPAAAALRTQETSIRGELDAFNASARAQLSDFDAQTESMRTGAVQMATGERNQNALRLQDRLHRIEVMPPEELAASYGGDYKEPNGFMARYRTLLQIVDEPDPLTGWFFTRNQMIAWGCRLVMIVFGLSVLYVKFVMTSPETKAYFSLEAQALGGNKEAQKMLCTLALKGDKDALRVLKLLASENPEAKAVLKRLGYDGSIEHAARGGEVTSHHREVQHLRLRLAQAAFSYEDKFRAMCRERFHGLTGNLPVSRLKLTERARNWWSYDVAPWIRALNQAEDNLQGNGIALPVWDTQRLGADPRITRETLWELEDESLVADFGWEIPADASFEATPVMEVSKTA